MFRTVCAGIQIGLILAMALVSAVPVQAACASLPTTSAPCCCCDESRDGGTTCCGAKDGSCRCGEGPVSPLPSQATAPDTPRDDTRVLPSAVVPPHPSDTAAVSIFSLARDGNRFQTAGERQAWLRCWQI